MSISFANEVRNELARIVSDKTCCQRAELIALIRCNGTLSIAQRQIGVILKTDNASVARKIFKLIRNNYNLFTEIVVRQKMRFHRHNSYQVKIPPQKGTREMLMEMGVLDESYRFNYLLDSEVVSKECCARSYLRGTFLGAGSVNHPEGGYHLEFSCDREEYAQELLRFFAVAFEVEGSVVYRKSSYVIYFKSSEDISTLLNIMGAHTALLKFEDYRVMKNIKNDVNRRVNCETANLDKTINAAMQQVEDIELIERHQGLDTISAGLREIARMRLAHPYVSLKELGQLLNPPLSKSGVNGRLRRISKIAEQIRSKSK